MVLLQKIYCSADLYLGMRIVLVHAFMQITFSSVRMLKLVFFLFFWAYIRLSVYTVIWRVARPLTNDDVLFYWLPIGIQRSIPYIITFLEFYLIFLADWLQCHLAFLGKEGWVIIMGHGSRLTQRDFGAGSNKYNEGGCAPFPQESSFTWETQLLFWQID